MKSLALNGILLSGGMVLGGLGFRLLGAALVFGGNALRNIAGPGSGGCFVGGTPVLLGDGSKVAIEDIRVGQRVATDAGVANSANGRRKAADPDATSVDPKTWRLVTLEINARSSNGGVDVMQVQELIPLSELRGAHAKIGGYIPVPLDLGDINEIGEGAIVRSIDPCPAIARGPGRVVLSTITHLNDYGFYLKLQNAQGDEDTVRITGFHKMFSEDDGWVSAVDLVPGESIRSDHGTLTVVPLIRDPGVHQVYNLTVEADHVYYVGAINALSHNVIGCSLDRKTGKMSGDLPKIGDVTREEAPQFIRDLRYSIEMREFDNDFVKIDSGHAQRLLDEMSLLNALIKIFGDFW